MYCYYNHVRRVYCTPTIPQVAYAAGIAIFYLLEKVHAGNRPPRVPSVFHLFFYPLGTLVLYQTHVATVNEFGFHYRQK